MAGTNIDLHQNPTYTCKEASRQQQLLYDSPQQQQPIYDIPNETPAVSSLVPELVPKEVVSSNIRLCNYSIQKEHVKWSILLIILFILVTLITLITIQVTHP